MKPNPSAAGVSDQVNQLVSASEADPDRGFMARLLALCSLPRSNPGNRTQYKRVNGPYTLYMNTTADNKLPYGNLPRLLMAWLSTEAVRGDFEAPVLTVHRFEYLSETSWFTWSAWVKWCRAWGEASRIAFTGPPRPDTTSATGTKLPRLCSMAYSPMCLRQDHIGGYHCGATKTPDRYSAWLIGAWSTLRSSLFISAPCVP